MRTIKFRAWNKNRKCWEGEFNLYDGVDSQDEEEILYLQFTGLLDKNGKEIYEGDILRLDSWEGLQVVSFIEGAFCLATKGGDFSGDIHYIQHAGKPQSEVIGNVMENPSLLTQQD